MLGCDVYGPCSLEEHHPDLFWYGVHGVEGLFTIMGTGCEQVSRIQTKDNELAAGVWTGGRIGYISRHPAGSSRLRRDGLWQQGDHAGGELWRL